MNKVLWLVSWYPNKADPYSGDFIKRMAEAVAIYQPVHIIYVGKSGTGGVLPSRGKLNIEVTPDGMKEYMLYYSFGKDRPGPILKIRSLFYYVKNHVSIIRQLRKNDKLPDIVHVHVAMKAGLIALYLKWKYKIPYVLTEHWSGYYELSADSLFKKSFLEKYLTRRILKNASLLLPVSEHLGYQISHFWAQVSYLKIPNVVDTRLFYPVEVKKPQTFRFIHISSLLYPKNPEGIIRTFVHLLESDFDAELILTGPINDTIKQLLNDVTLPAAGRIRTTGEVSYEQVGRELRDADALVMFSFYENMPCVILEALCSGLPVIASRVGGVPEVVYQENGILVDAGEENQLLEAMKKMILNYSLYDKQTISRMAMEQYSYETIGRKITEIYDEILEKKN